MIDYSILVDDAMHFIVKRSLEIFAESDSRGEHHFFISFVTKYPGVTLSEKLQNKYPYEMTIVLQHQFEELKIDDDHFSVVLSFDHQPEKIIIPFASLTAFADPSVKFGLQFRHLDESQIEEIKNNQTTVSKKKPINTSKSKSDEQSANVISLDFHNKKRL